MAQLSNLRLIDNEVEVIRGKIETGEPTPASLTLRARIGALVKHRLKRLLWWYDFQTKELARLAALRGHEETNILQKLSSAIDQLSYEVRGTQQSLDAISQKAKPLSHQLEAVHHMICECRRNTQQLEDRLAALDKQNVQQDERLGSMEAVVKEGLGSMQSAFEERLQAEGAVFRRDISATNDALTSTEAHFVEQMAALTQQLEQPDPKMDNFARRLSELGMSTHQTRAALSIQDHRLSLFIAEARKQSPKAQSLTDLIENHTDHHYDALYGAFEDLFRGTRDDIKSRQSVYLPVLREHGIGCKAMPILDLGCGRGEWLELLGEHGLAARGIDQNENMIERCRSAGLNVTQADAFVYLSGLPDASLGAVTSFHMVEHMPFDLVLATIDEALRVLKAGGVLILETPNPQNILVAAYTFHFDPSHRKPLPSPMLRFYVEARGFCNVEVKELHPYPESTRLVDRGDGVASRLNEYFYGPQDYAVIGYRP